MTYAVVYVSRTGSLRRMAEAQAWQEAGQDG